METQYVEVDSQEIIPEYQLYERFDDMLNDVYGTVSIGEYEYNTAYALQKMDSVAYEEDFRNWLDNEITDGVYEEVE